MVGLWGENEVSSRVSWRRRGELEACEAKDVIGSARPWLGWQSAEHIQRGAPLHIDIFSIRQLGIVYLRNSPDISSTRGIVPETPPPFVPPIQKYHHFHDQNILKLLEHNQRKPSINYFSNRPGPLILVSVIGPVAVACAHVNASPLLIPGGMPSECSTFRVMSSALDRATSIVTSARMSPGFSASSELA